LQRFLPSLIRDRNVQHKNRDEKERLMDATPGNSLFQLIRQREDRWVA
jgi:hypothetical protein